MIEIGNAHPRHFPRSINQLSIGMLSIAEIGRSHLGHRERGEMTERSLGHLVMHTLRNEPTHAPKANATNSSGHAVTDEARKEEFLRRQQR
jgi:hypothetical protein